MRACAAVAAITFAIALPRWAGADAPPGRYTVANGTVKDNRTGLLWQQTVDPGSYTQNAANTFCSGLNLGGHATGWRLPSVAELLSIADASVYNPAIDATAFPGTPVDYFWTSSPYVGISGVAWIVDFYSGGSGAFPPTNAYRVRCVR
jgi:hypothetical protein